MLCQSQQDDEESRAAKAQDGQHDDDDPEREIPAEDCLRSTSHSVEPRFSDEVRRRHRLTAGRTVRQVARMGDVG